MFQQLEIFVEGLLNTCAGAGAWGYVIIGLLIAVENIFPPIPSEVILGLGGALTADGSLVPWITVLSATSGAYIGAIVLYLVGRFFDAERLKRIVDGKAGRVLRVKGDDIEKAVKWFERRGELSVLVCRCIPIVRSLISVPAGTCGMRLTKFSVYTFIGSAAWNTLLVFLGNTLGQNWRTIP